MNTQTLIKAGTILLASGAMVSAASANDQLMKMSKDPSNWVMWGGNYAGTRYSGLKQINDKNVDELRVAWTFSTGVLRGHEGGPLIMDGRMYLHTAFPNKVFAIELKDHTLAWSYEPKQNAGETIPVMCCDTVNRGLAYGDGKILLQQADTTLVALDAKTGKGNRSGAGLRSGIRLVDVGLHEATDELRGVGTGYPVPGGRVRGGGAASRDSGSGGGLRRWAGRKAPGAGGVVSAATFSGGEPSPPNSGRARGLDGAVVRCRP